MIKKLSYLVLFMAGIQLLRMGIEQLLFLVVARTYFTDHVATMIAMIILTIALLILAKARRIDLSIFPAKFTWPYIISTLILAFLLISTPIITGDSRIKVIVVMIYASVVTPVFEELFFRGYVWTSLKAVTNNEVMTYIITSILFALWHLGYVEGIAFRVSDGLAWIMLWKVIIGLLYGLIVGAVRLRTKNCYLSIVLHGIMNIFGR